MPPENPFIPIPRPAHSHGCAGADISALGGVAVELSAWEGLLYPTRSLS